jgi:hypothetical protein
VTARVERAVRVVPGTKPDRAPNNAGLESVQGSRFLRRDGFEDRDSSLQIRHILQEGERSVAKLPTRAWTREEGLSRTGLWSVYELERHRGAFEILILLGHEGYACKSRMRKLLIPSQLALDKALESLVKQALVEESHSESFPFAKYYKLSARGFRLVTTSLLDWPVVEVV